MKCCICKGEIGVQVFPNGATWEHGHNAEPVVEDGRCCSVCNDTVVIPKRLEIFSSQKKERVNNHD